MSAPSTVLHVMAAPAEFGPRLRERITPLMIGIGPVEAAVSVAAELSRRAVSGALPDLVVSLGSAGSRSLPPTGIYQVSSISYRDIDVSPLGFEKGATPLSDAPVVFEIPHRIPGLPAASLSTGADIVTGAAYDAIDADMVDMETWAVWRACRKFAVPMIGLRGVSDGDTDLGHIDDWKRHLETIDAGLALALDALDGALASGLLG